MGEYTFSLSSSEGTLGKHSRVRVRLTKHNRANMNGSGGGNGEYSGEILGEILEIGGLTLAQTGSLRTEGTGLNTPLAL